MIQNQQDWRAFYTDTSDRGQPNWPSETLIRLFRGNYIPDLPKDHTGKTICEVGCGDGNNTRLFASLGMQVSGTEIHEDICTTVKANLSRAGIDADLRVGLNTSLPFNDNSFDYLVSWNVLHYETCEADIETALREYARVLKPGGRVIVSSTGPEHWVIKDANPLGNHRYELGSHADFRSGTTQFFFDHENYIRLYFERAFSDLLIGRIHDNLFSNTLDWWLITAVKG